MQNPLPHRTGQTLMGRFRLDKVLGEGGMGTVYRAFDLELNTPIALKLLANQATRQIDIVRFRREFRSAKRLDHPCCIQVADFFQIEKDIFFTMELASGGSLHRKRITDAPTLARLGMQALAALDHIHGHSIVHRDIKPHNLLLDETGQLRISDFGIVSVADHDSSIALGQLLGSAKFLSPEQANGMRPEPRSDLYSLGMVLYELAAGRAPYSPDPAQGSMGWLTCHRSHVPSPLAPLWPQAPAPLTEWVMLLLEKDLRRRPRTAAAAFDSLADIARQEGWNVPNLPPLKRRGFLRSPPLLGRTSESNRLLEFLHEAHTLPSAPRGLFIQGEAGVGKSRLVQEIIRSVESKDYRLILCEGNPEREAAYQTVEPLLQRTAPAFKPYTDDATKTVRLASHQKPPDSTEAWSSHSSSQSRHPLGMSKLYERVLQTLRHMAYQNLVVLVIDDLQWADPASVDLLDFLLREMGRSQKPESKLALIFLYRSEPSPGVEKIRKAAGVDPPTVTLEPLTESMTHALIASMLDGATDPGTLATIFQQVGNTRPNPLEVSQALHAMVASERLVFRNGKWYLGESDQQASAWIRSVRAAAGERTMRFSSSAKSVLAAAAILGRDFDLDLLSKVLGIDGLVALDALDELIRAEFISELGDGRYQFNHDQLREAVESDLEESARQALHRRAAQALIDLKERQLALRIANHWSKAGDVRREYAYLLRAAQQSLRAESYSSASAIYQRALQCAYKLERKPHGRTWRRAADAHMWSGQYTLAVAQLTHLLPSIRKAEDKIDLLTRFAEIEFRRGDTSRAAMSLESALSQLDFPVPATRRRLWIQSARAVVRWVIGYFQKERENQTIIEKPREDFIVQLCLRMPEVFYFTDYLKAFYYIVEGANRVRTTSPPQLKASSYALQGLVLYFAGFFEIGESYFKRAFELEVPGMVKTWLYLLSGLRFGAQGNLQGFEREIIRALTDLEGTLEGFRMRELLALKCHILLLRGEPTQALRTAHKLAQVSEVVDDARCAGWGAMLMGLAHARLEQESSSEKELKRGTLACEKGGDLLSVAVCQSRLGFYLALRGDSGQGLPLTHQAHRNGRKLALNHPNLATEPCFIAAAGLALLDGAKLTPEVARDAKRSARNVMRWSKTIQLARPFAHTARGVLWLALGKRNALEEIDAGIALAEEMGLWGESLDLNRLAHRALSAKGLSGQHYRHRIEQLRRREELVSLGSEFDERDEPTTAPDGITVVDLPPEPVTSKTDPRREAMS